MRDRDCMLTHAALLGLAVTASACATRAPGTDSDDGETGSDGSSTGDGDGDTGANDVPLELVSASFDATGKFVALRFSEAVGPVANVDPADFRISFALPTILYVDGQDIEQTSYWDPLFFVEYYITGGPYSGARFEVDLVSAGNQPTDVFLRFANALDPVLCTYTDDYGPDYEFLFVHYSPGDIPLQSADGEPLAAIGMQWVEQPDPIWETEGLFPNLDPKVAIPCSL